MQEMKKTDGKTGEWKNLLSQKNNMHVSPHLVETRLVLYMQRHHYRIIRKYTTGFMHVCAHRVALDFSYVKPGGRHAICLPAAIN